MRVFLAFLLLVSFSLAGCDASGDTPTAQLSVRMTDAPFPFDLAEAAEVTITRIEALAAEDDGDAANDTSNTEAIADRMILFDGEPFRLNLLDLRDGVDTLLVEHIDIPADGRYNRLRIYVGEDAEVRFTDGTVYGLKLPSAQQSGIKVALPDYTADENGEIDVLLDFDVERSFVTRGAPDSANFQGFLFKPVLEVKSFQAE